MTGPVVAFYAPMKAPDHPVPSGDREIARLTLRALETAGFDPFVASDLRIYDGKGDSAVQADLFVQAQSEVDRLIDDLSDQRPALWFTYHSYYKAPDLIGPKVARALGIPYAISEPSISPKRREGPWADFAQASEDAIAQADRLFYSTDRDRPALQNAGHGDRMVHLKPFIDPGPVVPARDAGTPLRLLTVAMMRPGDKLESYRRLAAGLKALDAGLRPEKPVANRFTMGMLEDGSLSGEFVPAGYAPPVTKWTIDLHGDGAARTDVEALFSAWPDKSRFHGSSDGKTVRRAYQEADILVWPGVGEGVGMVYLEAQATALPVVAEDHPAQRELVFSRRVSPDDPAEMAEEIRIAAAKRGAYGLFAQKKVYSYHSLTAAAETLGTQLRALL